MGVDVIMPSRDALIDAELAAAKATASPASSTTVNTTTLAGVNAASTPAPTPVAATGLEAQVGLSSSELTKLPTETNTQFLARVNAAKAAERATSIKANPLLDKSVTPKAQSGYEYKWIGGTDTGQWQLYKNATVLPVVGGTSGTSNAVVEDPAITAAKIAADTAAKAAADAAAKVAADKAVADAAAKKSEINAIAFLNSTYSSFGLGGDIATAITNLVQQGYTADTIQLIAQDPKSKDPLAIAFQQRFPANAARLNAGLPVLSPAEYLATERSYAQTMQAYGLNSNFATNKDIFTKLLTNDISPTELNSRISTAKQVVENTDPLVTQQLQAYYGISQGDMIAHVLDPSIATPIIEKQISASQIGAGAARFGTDINQSYAEQLSGLGITQSQANQGFQNIAQQLPGTQELAARYSAYGPAGQAGAALQAATFGTTGSTQAAASLERLKMQEISQFSGSSGAGKGSLMGTEAGLS